jgi:transcriptional regulator with XRE-family HTH domain
MSISSRVKRATKELRKPGKSLTRILAQNLRGFRSARNLSQEDFAELCGLHRTYVGSVEREERNVTLSTLEAFSKALGVSVPKLLTLRSYEGQVDD